MRKGNRKERRASNNIKDVEFKVYLDSDQKLTASMRCGDRVFTEHLPESMCSWNPDNVRSYCAMLIIPRLKQRLAEAIMRDTNPMMARRLRTAHKREREKMEPIRKEMEARLAPQKNVKLEVAPPPDALPYDPDIPRNKWGVAIDWLPLEARFDATTGLHPVAPPWISYRGQTQIKCVTDDDKDLKAYADLMNEGADEHRQYPHG